MYTVYYVVLMQKWKWPDIPCWIGSVSVNSHLTSGDLSGMGTISRHISSHGNMLNYFLYVISSLSCESWGKYYLAWCTVRFILPLIMSLLLTESIINLTSVCTLHISYLKCRYFVWTTKSPCYSRTEHLALGIANLKSKLL
jgi:hypothetical protein